MTERHQTDSGIAGGGAIRTITALSLSAALLAPGSAASAAPLAEEATEAGDQTQSQQQDSAAQQEADADQGVDVDAEGDQDADTEGEGAGGDGADGEDGAEDQGSTEGQDGSEEQDSTDNQGETGGQDSDEASEQDDESAVQDESEEDAEEAPEDSAEQEGADEFDSREIDAEAERETTDDGGLGLYGTSRNNPDIVEVPGLDQGLYETGPEAYEGGFTPEQMDWTRYDSYGLGDHGFLPHLSGYDDFLADDELWAYDRQLSVEINNSLYGDDARMVTALEDQYGDQALTGHTGLGSELGPIFLEAVHNGDLPKTWHLISSDYGGGGQGIANDGSSSNPAKEHWVEDSPRPYFSEEEELYYVDVLGGNAQGSTSGDYPSGHTAQAYWQLMGLATIFPEASDGILARAADAGQSRILLGTHSPSGVMGGRMLGTAIVAQRWEDEEFRELFLEAREELLEVFEDYAGAPVDEVLERQTPYLPQAEALALYEERLHYGFPQVGETGQALEVPAGAADMLRFAHPELTDEQRAQVLQLTALDSGYPLDISGEYGGWQRMNLQAALTAEVTVDEAGNVVLGSSETDSEAGTEADTEPETGAESGSDGDTGSGAGADGQTEAGAEAGAEADDESGAEQSAEGDRSAAEVSLSAAEVAAGDQVTVSASGLQPGEQAVVEINPELAQVEVDEEGSFQAEVTIPADLEPGVYDLTVAGEESGISGSAQLTVTEAADADSGTGAESGAGADEGQTAGADAAVGSDQGSTQGALASTGFGVAGIAALGLALLVVGGVLLRRSHREA